MKKRMKAASMTSVRHVDSDICDIISTYLHIYLHKRYHRLVLDCLSVFVCACVNLCACMHLCACVCLCLIARSTNVHDYVNVHKSAYQEQVFLRTRFFYVFVEIEV